MILYKCWAPASIKAKVEIVGCLLLRKQFRLAPNCWNVCIPLGHVPLLSTWFYFLFQRVQQLLCLLNHKPFNYFLLPFLNYYCKLQDYFLVGIVTRNCCSVKWSCNLVVASILINSRGYTGYTIHKVAIQLLAALLNEVYEYSYWHPRFVCDRCTPCLYNVQSTPNTLRKHENKGKLIKPVSIFLVVISG